MDDKKMWMRLVGTMLLLTAAGTGVAGAWDPRWHIVSTVAVSLAYAITVMLFFTMSRKFEQAAVKAAEAMATEASWRERAFVLESLDRALRDGEGYEQWHKEYQNYIAAHVVAAGHLLKNPGGQG